MKYKGSAYQLTITSVILIFIGSFSPGMTVNAGGGATKTLLIFSDEFARYYGKTLGIVAGAYTLDKLSPDQKQGLSRLTIDPSVRNTISGSNGRSTPVYSFDIALPENKLDSPSLDARLRKILLDSSNPEK